MRKLFGAGPALVWLAVGAATAISASIAGPASAASTASTACTTRSVAQKFLSVDGDANWYFSAPAGTFEAGATGWRLNGAKVGSGNEPRFVNGATHSRSLQVSSGGSAQSPSFCNQYGERSVRFFFKGSPGAKIRLHIDVSNAQNSNRSTLDWEASVPATGWGAANGIMIPDMYTEGYEYLQLTFSAVGGSVQVDDVEIDPFKSL